MWPTTQMVLASRRASRMRSRMGGWRFIEGAERRALARGVAKSGNVSKRAVPEAGAPRPRRSSRSWFVRGRGRRGFLQFFDDLHDAVAANEGVIPNEAQGGRVFQDHGFGHEAL